MKQNTNEKSYLIKCWHVLSHKTTQIYTNKTLHYNKNPLRDSLKVTTTTTPPPTSTSTSTITTTTK